MLKILSIAGSDPSGGAGIQADLKVFQALGAFGMAIPAALTVQNSKGVAGTYPVAPRAIAEQLDFLLFDIKPDAVKTGMLLTKQGVEAVAKAVRKYKLRNLVVDPVIRSSSGRLLLKKDALTALTKRLFPLALVITPNIPEAEALIGGPITTEEETDFAAGKLLDMGPKFVLIKGGHRSGPAADTLYGGKSVLTFSTDRLAGEFHGTGCALSAALTLFIGQGLPVEKAVEKAKQVVDGMLKKAKQLGEGKTKYLQI